MEPGEDRRDDKVNDATTTSSNQKEVDIPERPNKHGYGVEPEYPEGEPPRTGYGEDEVVMLREIAQQEAQEGEPVDLSPIPENTYRTPKEKLAAAIEKYTPSQPGEGSHGVHRIH